MNYVCFNLILGTLLCLVFTRVTVCLIIGILVLSFLLAGIYLYAFSKKDVSARYKKQKLICAMILISYSLYLLLPLNKIPEPKMEWKVPTVKISEKIEKNELGIFYHLTKYINQDEGFAFHYQACSSNNIFTIVQSEEKVLSIDTGKIDKSDKMPFAVFSKNINRSGIPCEQHYNNIFIDNKSSIEGFDCLNDIKKPDLNSNGNPLYHSTCEKLTYNGKEIFAESYPDSSDTIDDITLSQNKEWALINVENGIYATHELYLIDLRSLK